MTRYLTHDEARRFYDRFGARQEWQRFYEDPATALLVRHAGFAGARRVVEFGCGPARLAEQLLTERLPPDARYLGVDISPSMTSLAARRLARFENRAAVVRTNGKPQLPVAAESCDRFVSTYVLDLLAPVEVRAVIREADRVLVRGGRLCLVTLAPGRSPVSRAVTSIWCAVHALNPMLVGGCRPLDVASAVGGDHWQIDHAGHATRFGLTSAVVVATRR